MPTILLTASWPEEPGVAKAYACGIGHHHRLSSVVNSNSALQKKGLGLHNMIKLVIDQVCF